jgi:hypothetical protein
MIVACRKIASFSSSAFTVRYCKSLNTILSVELTLSNFYLYLSQAIQRKTDVKRHPYHVQRLPESMGVVAAGGGAARAVHFIFLLWCLKDRSMLQYPLTVPKSMKNDAFDPLFIADPFVKVREV